MNIEAMSVGVKADGKLYLALLDGADLNLLANIVAIACPGGQLKLVEAPEGFALMTLDAIKEAAKC